METSSVFPMPAKPDRVLVDGERVHMDEQEGLNSIDDPLALMCTPYWGCYFMKFE